MRTVQYVSEIEICKQTTTLQYVSKNWICIDLVKVAVSRDFFGFFLYETNPPGPLIKRLKWFFWEIRYYGDIREISDSAQTNTEQSQQILGLSNISISGESRVQVLIFRNI